MHVFLTGVRGVGKSHAVDEIARKMGRSVTGFRTAFDESQCHLLMGFPDVRTFSENARLVAERRDGRMVPLADAFDEVGEGLLSQALLASHPDDGLILMDECGHLEKDAHRFRQMIRRCLDGRVPVLGVLREGQPWHDFIRNHPHVRVLEVTAENRNQIVEDAVALLRTELPIGKMMSEALIPWELNGERQPALLCTNSEIEALLIGMLLTGGGLMDADDIRISCDGDCIYRVTTRVPMVRMPLEARIESMRPIPSEKQISLSEAVSAIDSLTETGGGCHTAALHIGNERIVCRDIGRHNALDKAVGTACMRGLPLNDAVLCTSGRVNIEILAKAAAVGIPIICTRKQVGDLSERYASAWNMTIVQAGEHPCVFGAQRRITNR